MTANIDIKKKKKNFVMKMKVSREEIRDTSVTHEDFSTLKKELLEQVAAGLDIFLIDMVKSPLYEEDTRRILISLGRVTVVEEANPIIEEEEVEQTEEKS